MVGEDATLNIWDKRKLSKSLQMAVKELGLFRVDGGTAGEGQSPRPRPGASRAASSRAAPWPLYVLRGPYRGVELAPGMGGRAGRW